MVTLQELLSIDLPIIQAPMAGTSTPALAAAVSNAGGLGSLGLGSSSPAIAREAILLTQKLSQKPFNANFFCHTPSPRVPATEQAWIQHAQPLFDRFNAKPPSDLPTIYKSFQSNNDYLDLVLELRPAVVSFHFGLPLPHQRQALLESGLCLIASATSLKEARAITDAGFHAVIAQGWQAGGHRGMFDPDGPDERLTTDALTKLLVRETDLPVIAAGGIMDGRDIGHALDNGAIAAMLGTAFIGCPESAADEGYRARLAKGGSTVMTRAISGRPARCLTNSITEWLADVPDAEVPTYPNAYALGKALNDAAKASGQTGYGAQWSGTEASRARTMPAAALIATLMEELRAAG